MRNLLRTRSLSLPIAAIAVFVNALLLSVAPALACAVCWGASDSKAVQAANAGVLVLLAVIGSVLVWVAGMIVFFVRRVRHIETPPSAS